MRTGSWVMSLLLAATVAAGGALWMRADEAVERADALARELAPLRERLAAESAARAKLEAEATQLRDALAAAQRSDVATPAPIAPGPGARAADEHDVAASDPPADAAHGAAPGLPDGVPSLDADRLLAAGFRRDEVERFRARVDEIELARLALRDRATREGWLETPRFLQESRALNASLTGLRSEFGDALYDWVLYTTGHPNRVAVAEVLTGSAAESAGLARGDVILRYDDVLMLDAGALRDATVTGRPGELVAVEVQRQGESGPLRIFVPRGPIGVRLAPAALEPAPQG